MEDKICIVGKGSVIQHGKLSDRVYLMKMHDSDFPGIVTIIDNLAIEQNYSKVFCKVPWWAVPAFFSYGYITEAIIPEFYNNKDDVFFVSKFLAADRMRNSENEQFEQLSKMYKGYEGKLFSDKLPESFSLNKLDTSDAEDISNVFRQVFESYPFPVFQPEYIKETMHKHIQYYGVKINGKLAAIASAETDTQSGNAEMTDFATLPEYRGNKLSLHLLSAMEKEMKTQGIETLYTIARLHSPAMNNTFLKLHYKYSGTLVKNTNIAGKLESMNVYYKHI